MARELELTEAQFELLTTRMKEIGVATIEEYLLYLMETDMRTPEQHAQWRRMMEAAEGDGASWN